MDGRGKEVLDQLPGFGLEVWIGFDIEHHVEIVAIAQPVIFPASRLDEYVFWDAGNVRDEAERLPQVNHIVVTLEVLANLVPEPAPSRRAKSSRARGHCLSAGRRRRGSPLRRDRE